MFTLFSVVDIHAGDRRIGGRSVISGSCSTSGSTTVSPVGNATVSLIPPFTYYLHSHCLHSFFLFSSTSSSKGIHSFRYGRDGRRDDRRSDSRCSRRRERSRDRRSGQSRKSDHRHSRRRRHRSVAVIRMHLFTSTAVCRVGERQF